METKKQNTEDKSTVTPTIPLCGLIMPISPIDGCDALHWNAVNRILSEAIGSAGYKARMVSESDGSGIIQKNIVQNLYYDPIVVCDVSGKNPNVMFELGLRLAFDKPTVIVKDDKTDYSFDTSPIEHIPYPRDLSYYDILNFKETLKNKIVATLKDQKEGEKHSVFLQHFGKFKVAKIQDKDASSYEAIISKIDDLSFQISQLRKQAVVPIQRLSDRDDMRLIIKSIIMEELVNYCTENGIKDINILKDNPEILRTLMHRIINRSDSQEIFGTNPAIIHRVLKDVINNQL